MKMKNKIAVLIACTALLAGCSKAPVEVEPGSKLDWSQTSTITLGEVAMTSSTRASESMKIGQTFRLYAIDPTTKNIIATRTYTIKDVAGKPVVDDPQNAEIILPFGTVDIFLVGPVKAMLNAVETEIAGPTAVTPTRGVDLISSKTRVTVEKKDTEIAPTPLQHRMVKLELVVSMVKDDAGGELATYQDADLTKVNHGIGIENMGGTGTFAFDDLGGSVSSAPGAEYNYTYAIGNSDTGKIVLTTPGVQVGTPENGLTGAVYTVVDYVTPTSATTPKLSVTYGYLRRDASTKTLIDAHLMSGKTKDPRTWVGGTYIKISTTLIPSIDMTLRTEIKPWDDGGTTPVEPPVNNDLLFWYSGEDAPVMINGQSCWRDRSGNGNHAVINGDMVYDAVNKCYYATTGHGHFAIPALGQVAEYTLELNAQTVFSASNLPASFSGADGAGGIGMNLPYADVVVYYCPDQIQYKYSSDKYIWEQLNSYAFCRNATTAAIVINGVEKKSVAMSKPWASFDKNSIWGATSVSPEKQRLYGAKMYKKYMNDAPGRNTLAANHAAKLSQLGVNAPLNGTTFDYVKDGLVLDLGDSRIGTLADNRKYWVDKSPAGNHAVLTPGDYTGDGGIGGITLNGGYMTLLKPMGKMSEITIEVVMSSTANRGYQSLVTTLGPSPMSLWWPMTLADGVLLQLSGANINIKPSEYIYQMDPLAHISLSKSKAKSVTFRHNGYAYTNKNTTSTAPITELGQVNIGANLGADGHVYSVYLGTIYAVRIYNRALSDFERQHNYLADKAKYKILP